MCIILGFVHQLRNLYNQKPEERISIPYFPLCSLVEINLKVQAGKKEALNHHHLIILILCEEMRAKNPQLSWEKFIEKDALEM
jgi:hypothetical protein